MKRDQFNYIWETKVVNNGPWYAKAVNKNMTKNYRAKLIKFDKEVFSAAVDLLLKEAPKDDWNNDLPSIGAFIQYCRLAQDQKGVIVERKYCPCCDGSSIVLFNNVGHDCKCYLASGLKPRTASFKEKELDICDNEYCQNKGKQAVIEVSNEKAREFWEKLKACPFVKQIIVEETPF